MTTAGTISSLFVLLAGVVAIFLAFRWSRRTADPLTLLSNEYDRRDKAMLRAQRRVTLKHQRHINRALEAVNREWGAKAPMTPDRKA